MHQQVSWIRLVNGNVLFRQQRSQNKTEKKVEAFNVNPRLLS